MNRETRISAVVSETTKELLERHVRATGEALLKEIEEAKPTETLRDLLHDGD